MCPPSLLQQCALVHAVAGSSLAVLDAVLEAVPPTAVLDWVQSIKEKAGSADRQAGSNACPHTVFRTTPLQFAMQIGRLEAVRRMLVRLGFTAATPLAPTKRCP